MATTYTLPPEQVFCTCSKVPPKSRRTRRNRCKSCHGLCIPRKARVRFSSDMANLHALQEAAIKANARKDRHARRHPKPPNQPTPSPISNRVHYLK